MSYLLISDSRTCLVRFIDVSFTRFVSEVYHEFIPTSGRILTPFRSYSWRVYKRISISDKFTFHRQSLLLSSGVEVIAFNVSEFRYKYLYLYKKAWQSSLHRRHSDVNTASVSAERQGRVTKGRKPF